MTPAEEARFIELWSQGASYRELAQALGCPLGTVASRSAALVAQGKIQARQRGGSYPSRRAKARPEDPPPPVQSSAEMHGAQTVHNRAVQTALRGAEPVHSSAELPIPAALAAELTR